MKNLLQNSSPTINGKTIELNNELNELLLELEHGEGNVFITGKAGTGKSTILEHFRRNTKRKAVFLAPTGVAAMNIKGETIHSFFKLAPKLIQKKDIKPDYMRQKLLKNIDICIIDEISMVRADIIDGIDYSLRVNRGKLNAPFGGVKMVFVGDLMQLPPIVQNDLRDYFTNYYKSEYFFHAKVFEDNFDFKKFELNKVYRQSDEDFISILNKLRVGQIEYAELQALNKVAVKQGSDLVQTSKDRIVLTTRNAIVDNINGRNLSEITEPEFCYTAKLSGSLARFAAAAPEMAQNRFPAELHLRLKRNAQVMMIKNDSEKRWVNGSIGTVTKLNENEVHVNIDGTVHKVVREAWAEIEYNFMEGEAEVTEREKGKFEQFPIRLAWAVTIHKAQGKTFEKAHIDMGYGAFAPGQTYVALSRVKSLQGLSLSRPLQPRDIFTDQRVIEFLYG